MVVLWVTLLISSSLFGLAAANILPLFSNRIDSHRQGWIMGVTGSVVVLTGGVRSLIAGILPNINEYFPYLFSSAIIFTGIIFLFFDRKEMEENYFV